MAELATLVPDIYKLLDPEEHHEVNEENLEFFAETMKNIMRDRLKKQEPRGGALRFSSLGKPDRQIWYEHHGVAKEPMLPKTFMKFLYGDVIEALLLFLAKESGHEVRQQQDEVSVDDVKGHIDAIIDDTVVDVKSASPFGYQKFRKGTVTEEDPFGYVQQLAGYADVLTPGKAAAWLAMDKVSGDMCVSTLSSSVIEGHKPAERIAHLREVLDREEPPARCYEDVPVSKTSPNRKLSTGCSYCPFKKECWGGLRAFAYSNGPVYMTRVVKEPDVPEINLDDNPEVND